MDVALTNIETHCNRCRSEGRHESQSGGNIWNLSPVACPCEAMKSRNCTLKGIFLLLVQNIRNIEHKDTRPEDLHNFIVLKSISAVQ